MYMKKIRINLLVEENLKIKYKEFCLKHDRDMSKRIRHLIKLDMLGKIKI